MPGEAGQASPGQPGTVRDKIQMSKNGTPRGKTHTPPAWPFPNGRRPTAGADELAVFIINRYSNVK